MTPIKEQNKRSFANKQENNLNLINVQSGLDNSVLNQNDSIVIQ